MKRARGFTLLETMIALAIAGLAIAALMQGAGGGLQNTRLAAHYQEAVSRARSRLAVHGSALRPGEQNGDDGGGYDWQVTITPAASAGRPGQGGEVRPRAALYAVTVRIGWSLDGGRREVALASWRLGLAPAEPP